MWVTNGEEKGTCTLDEARGDYSVEILNFCRRGQLMKNDE